VVSTVFSTWLSEYPEDFRSLGEPSRLLHLAQLLPQDSSSAAELRAHVLRIAEELSEKALLPDMHKGQSGVSSPPPDASKFEPTNFLGFPAKLIAEQLTKIETELFVRLVPYHCLGSLWSQRDKKGREGVCWSVRATIRQFNRLATGGHIQICQPGQQTCSKGRLYEAWDARGNHPIIRKCTAHANNRQFCLKGFVFLCSFLRFRMDVVLFSFQLEYVVPLDVKSLIMTQSSAQGTVPYLGIFLTDLTMLDTAVKDRLDNGYINFDKRRREFEVLAQIRLLQSSCKNCIFTVDKDFVRWYQSVPTLTEEESYRLSSVIEAPSEPSPRALPPTVIVTQCPDLRSSQNSLVSDSDNLFDFPSPVNHLLSKLTKHMRSPSVSCLDVDKSPPTNDSTPATLTPSTPTKSHRRSASCGNNPTGNIQSSGSDMHIIRIRMDLQDGNLYRSILVTSNDKTPTVISSALEKHNQDPKRASRYELIQLLPEGKELVIPATGNVFYAMTTSSVDFLLRKREGDTPLGSEPINTETSATFPRIKAKGKRLVRTLF
uniref:Ral guanine nucleotide dissociation stimulator-like 2 n=2 Tax=Tetraodon nigroviridis TaxID=99883 RepID=H3CE32_TETNG